MIVFLQHFGGSALTAGPVIERLGGGMDTLALDLPGFGDAAGAPGPYTVDTYADFVEARVRAAGCGRYVLVGHSMGGKVALALAARRPAGLAALLLLSPSPPKPEPIDDDARAELIAGWGDQGVMSETLERTTAEPLPDDLRELAMTDMMRTGEAGWTAWLEAGSREDIAARVGSIAAPVTILSGTRDAVLPTELHEQTAAKLPDARLVAVPGAGHLLPLEAPDAVAREITSLASAVGLERNLFRATR